MGEGQLSDQSKLAPWRRWLIHALGVLLLSWPAIVNRQPFFFPDSTSYVRAADLAARIASGGRFQTAWTNNDAEPQPAAASTPPAKAREVTAPRRPHGSDGRDGNPVMSGRSPYFGALLYIGWVTSGFWLFVLAQAVVGWWLIGLALRCFDDDCPFARLGVTAMLGLLTPLSFFTGTLLADDLAGLGLLAFLILVDEPRGLGRLERIGLMLVLLMSVASHMTHIVMTLAMTVVLLLCSLLFRQSRRRVWRPLTIGIVATVLGLLSVSLTGIVVRHALGRSPAMAPLLTARFIIDGPGRDFVATGCGGRHFAVCRIPSDTTDSDIWLWSAVPGEGGFLSQTPAVRAELSREDTSFAFAVLAAYPLRQGGMIVLNTLKQLGSFDLAILSEGCIAEYSCASIVLPPSVRADMKASLAGRNAWPLQVITPIQYGVVLISLLVLAVLSPSLLRGRDPLGQRLLLWIILVAAAMLANAFFGGAVSAPQGRYQARIVWLIPLLAAIAVLAWRRVRLLKASE